MNIALWLISGALAAVFLASGAMKVAQPKEKLVAAGWEMVDALPTGAVKGIGILEVAAAVGLIVPAAFDIAPVLVPLAAVGVVLLMAGAVVIHARRGEIQQVALTVILLVLATVVAWGRFGPESFTG